MRIDFHYGAQPAPENSRTGEKEGIGTVNANSSNALKSDGDQAQLSAAHVEVGALAAQASQLPEIRQERVQSLREAVQAGHYNLDAKKTAAAMVKHMALGPAA